MLKKSPYSHNFEAWYSLYPRKVGKKNAFKAFNKALDCILEEDLMKHTMDYWASVLGKDKKYIPHWATWLNWMRWEDEIENPFSCQYEKLRYLHNVLKDTKSFHKEISEVDRSEYKSWYIKNANFLIKKYW